MLSQVVDFAALIIMSVANGRQSSLPDKMILVKLFVWDLHGTLEKGNEVAVLDISNKALARLGYRQRFNLTDTKRLYGIKWHEYFAQLLPQATPQEHTKLHQTSIQIAEEDLSWLERLTPTKHAHDVLAQIGTRHQQILLSNTSRKHLGIYVKGLSLDKHFKPHQVLSATQFVGDPTTKVAVLKNYLRGKRFEAVVTIGDRATDMELAEAVGGVGYLYAHPGWPFKAAPAHYKIRDLREVLREI